MRRRVCTILAAMAASLVVGCDKKQAAPPPMVPEVAVVTVAPEHLVLTTELPGRTSSYVVSEIRPQVSGLIQKRLFTEGSDVKAGQTLYQIDPAPFEAAHESAQAAVVSAQRSADRARAALAAGTAGVTRQQATVALAQTNRQRADDLFKDRAVSASERDEAVTAQDVAVAGLRAAEADVESARAAVAAAEAAIKQAQAAMQTTQINLGYTRINAPVAGRIGRSAVTEGATVTAYQPQALATIQQLDPIYVDVAQSTAELNRLKQGIASGKVHRDESQAQSVKLILEGGLPYGQKGTLKFRDVSVDPTTGSVTLRIVVPNPDGVLLPGMFVRAVVEEGVDDEALLIPQQAVSRDPRGNAMVTIVTGDNKIEYRKLTTGRAIGDRWVVTSGIAPGDRIIVEGIQAAARLKPGSSVKVVPLGAKAPAATNATTKSN